MEDDFARTSGNYAALYFDVSCDEIEPNYPIAGAVSVQVRPHENQTWVRKTNKKVLTK